MESVKYLFKYVYKRQMVRTAEAPRNGGAAEEPARGRDEITEYQYKRSIGASEACWRLFELPMCDRTPAVMALQVHLPNQQVQYFQAGQEQQAAAVAPRAQLTEWLQYNPCLLTE